MQTSAAEWGALSSTFQSCLDEAFLDGLAGCGWSITTLTQLGAADANYGRWLAPVYPIDDPERGTTLYVCAEKVRGMSVDGLQLDQRVDVDATWAFAAAPTDTSDADHRPPTTGEEAGEEVRGAAAEAPDEEDDPLDDGPSPSSSAPRPPPARSLQVRERAIERWSQRAAQYAALLEGQPLFSTLAHRLVDLLNVSAPASPIFLARFHAIDLACGAGCAADALLSRYPLAQVHLIEPAPSMLNLAQRRLEGMYGSAALLSSQLLRAEDVRLLAAQVAFQPVDAVLCNAAMQAMREEDVYPQVAAILRPGGSFVHNLWAHSWADGCHRAHEESRQWKRLINRALLRHQEPPHYPPPPTASEEEAGVDLGCRSLEGLTEVARRSGLVVADTLVDEDEVRCELMVEWAAMTSEWLRRLGAKAAQVLDTAKELARRETMPIRTIRIRLVKVGSPPPLNSAAPRQAEGSLGYS